jgi:hypothetical protein
MTEDLVSRSPTIASKSKYHKELDRIKQRANEAKGEVAEMHNVRLQNAKESFKELTKEGRSCMENKLVPLNQKMRLLKEEATSYSDRTEEKWQEIKKETEELLETTKQAVHNFKETFKSHQKL